MYFAITVKDDLVANDIERQMPEADRPGVEKVVNFVFELDVEPEPRGKRPP